MEKINKLEDAREELEAIDDFYFWQMCFHYCLSMGKNKKYEYIFINRRLFFSYEGGQDSNHDTELIFEIPIVQHRFINMLGFGTLKDHITFDKDGHTKKIGDALYLTNDDIPRLKKAIVESGFLQRIPDTIPIGYERIKYYQTANNAFWEMCYIYLKYMVENRKNQYVFTVDHIKDTGELKKFITMDRLIKRERFIKGEIYEQKHYFLLVHKFSKGIAVDPNRIVDELGIGSTSDKTFKFDGEEHKIGVYLYLNKSDAKKLRDALEDSGFIKKSRLIIHKMMRIEKFAEQIERDGSNIKGIIKNSPLEQAFHSFLLKDDNPFWVLIVTFIHYMADKGKDHYSFFVPYV